MPESAVGTDEPNTVATADASRGMTLFVLTVATLYFGKEVLVPITLALLLAFVLAPPVGLLRRLRLGRVPSVLLAVLAAVGLMLALGGVIGSQIAQLTTSLPQYTATVEQKVEKVRDATIGRISSLTDRIGNPGNGPAAGTPTALCRVIHRRAAAVRAGGGSRPWLEYAVVDVGAIRGCQGIDGAGHRAAGVWA